jgi:hypothetical protein
MDIESNFPLPRNSSGEEDRGYRGSSNKIIIKSPQKSRKKMHNTMQDVAHRSILKTGF